MISFFLVTILAPVPLSNGFAVLDRSRASSLPSHRSHLVRSVRKAIFAKETAVAVAPDYLITDIEDESDKTPFLKFVNTPQNLLNMALIATGVAVSGFNVVGNYGELYLTLEILAFSLGFANALLDYISSLPPYKDPTTSVSPNVRCGVVDDALLHVYSGAYTMCAVWLGLRTSPLCPAWLPSLDIVISPFAVAAFVFSLVAPLLTLINHYTGKASGPLRSAVGLARREPVQNEVLPALTETELLRARGLLAIGVVGCLYAPEASILTMKGQDWWSRVSDVYPGQGLVESSTAMFGIFATQASMLAHRAGKAGVAPFRVIVPTFAGVCLFLTLFPCFCVLYWLSDQISFFDFYNL